MVKGYSELLKKTLNFLSKFLKKFAASGFEYLGEYEDFHNNTIIIRYKWYGQEMSEPFDGFINSFYFDFLPVKRTRKLIKASFNIRKNYKKYLVHQCIENPEVFTLVDKTTREETCLLAIDIYRCDQFLENIDAASIRRVSQYVNIYLKDSTLKPNNDLTQKVIKFPTKIQN